MSEKEKKAIELLKEIADVRSCVTGDDLFEEDALTLLNLITKLQKEIETLKESQLVLYDKEGNIIACLKLGKDVVSKEKIREKINQLEEQCKKELLTTWLESQIDILKELLGE